jgi:hypothetical protein
MKHLKEAVFAMALVLGVCAGATSASATTISPANTSMVLTSTNSSLTIHGSSSINCNSSTISGTTPSGTATTLSMPVTLAYSGCTAFGVAGATVNVPAACSRTGTSPVHVNFMYSSATTIDTSVTITSGCVITVSVPLITCTVTIAGHLTVNNGINVHDGTVTTKTQVIESAATVPLITVHAGGGFGCPTAGAHSDTLNGTYTVTTPAAAPGVIVTP